MKAGAAFKKLDGKNSIKTKVEKDEKRQRREENRLIEKEKAEEYAERFRQHEDWD